MANKENELACAGHLPEKLRHDNRTYLVNSSDPGSSQKAHHQNIVVFFLRFLRTMKQWPRFYSAGICD